MKRNKLSKFRLQPLSGRRPALQQPTVLYLILEMKHAPSLHLSEKGREDLEGGLASIKEAFDGCTTLDHRPPEVPREFLLACGSHLLIDLIPYCSRKSNVAKIFPAEFFEETEIFQRRSSHTII